MPDISLLAALLFLAAPVAGAQSLLEQGDAAAREGNEELAIAKFSEAIQTEPAKADLYARRGGYYFFLARFDKALLDHTEAVRLDPDNARYHNHRGNDFRHLGDFARAIAEHTEAIRLAPDDRFGYAWRAYAYERSGDFGRAVSDLLESFRLNPEDTDPCLAIASILATCPDAKVRDGKRAVEYAWKGSDLLQWRTPFYMLTLAAAYAEAGDFQEAIRWQEKFIAGRPRTAADQPEARRRLALYRANQPFHKVPWNEE